MNQIKQELFNNFTEKVFGRCNFEKNIEHMKPESMILFSSLFIYCSCDFVYLFRHGISSCLSTAGQDENSTTTVSTATRILLVVV